MEVRVSGVRTDAVEKSIADVDVIADDSVMSKQRVEEHVVDELVLSLGANHHWTTLTHRRTAATHSSTLSLLQSHN